MAVIGSQHAPQPGDESTCRGCGMGIEYKRRFGGTNYGWRHVWISEAERRIIDRCELAGAPAPTYLPRVLPASDEAPF